MNENMLTCVVLSLKLREKREMQFSLLLITYRIFYMLHYYNLLNFVLFIYNDIILNINLYCYLTSVQHANFSTEMLVGE
jgi:hypothetical protein